MADVSSVFKHNWEIQNKTQGKPEMFTRNGTYFYVRTGKYKQMIKTNREFLLRFSTTISISIFFFVTQKRITIDT